MIKSKICWNCGAVMTWNFMKNRWECLSCGNSEEDKKLDEFLKPGYLH